MLPTGKWDLLHLVRNPLGFPVTPDDGDLLLETTSDVSYVDRRTDPLTGAVTNPRIVEGKTYYYAIFVRRTSDSKWFNAGVTIGTAVKNFGTAEMMYSYLPLMYRTSSINGLSSDVGSVNTDLYNFLSMFAFEHDKFKTDVENVKSRYDVANLNGRLIPVMMNQFGFTYEKEMGLQQGRRLLQNAIAIYSEKGSAAGLKTFVSAFSGYNVALGTAKNLMLNLDDSSFEKTLGSWDTTVNGTLSTISGASESPAVSPYLESTSPANYPNATSGLLKLAITSAATASFSCGDTAPTTRGIPVAVGSEYTFTIYSRAKSNARSISLNIKWYDRFGAYLSSGTAATSTNSTSGWTRATKVTATAPSNAQFAVPTISVAGGGAGEIHYFDAAQFELGSTAHDYVDARRIDIYLDANRVNEIINPSFETNTNNWTAFNGTIARTTGVGPVSGSAAWLDLTAGTSAPSLKASGSGAGGLIPVSASTPYTFTSYLKGSAAGDTAKVRVIWFDSSVTTIESVNGTADFISTSWARCDETLVSPSNAAFAFVFIDFTSTSGNVISVDAVMFEAASYAQTYFDGSTGYYETGDILWENGSAVNGRSLYYRNRVNVTKRLATVLPDYVPYGAQWALFAGVSHA